MFGDDLLLALAIWREARGEPLQGREAVGSVIRNRVNFNKSSYYREVVKPWQFSSITAKGDPQLNLWPQPNDPVNWSSWQEAQQVAQGIMNGTIADPTGGAMYYYATSIPLPSWARNMTMMCQIGNQRFYK